MDYHKFKNLFKFATMVPIGLALLFGLTSVVGQTLAEGFVNIRVQGVLMPILMGISSGTIISFLVTRNRRLLAGQLEIERNLAQNLADLVAERTAQLSESEEKFRLIAETSPNAISISRVSDGLLRYANPASSKMLGVENGTMVGRRAQDFYFNPEERAPLMARLQETGLIQNNEILLKKVDGSPLPVLFSAAVADFGGEPHLFIEVIDISERKLAEAALAESESRHRKLYNETPVMLHSIAADGTITRVSDFWLAHLGYERDEVIGKSITDFQDEQSKEYSRNDGIPQFLENGVRSNVPLRFVKKNGEVIDTLLSALLEQDEDGNFLGSLSVILDITAQKQTEAALVEAEATAQQASAAKSEFLSSVSHELRTPLNAILGFGQLLELDMDGEASEEHQSHVRHILESGGHLLQLINQVLELSQIEAGKISLSLETFDPERVLEECKDMVQERARENQIALTINTGGKLPFITTDKLRFRQIILNLLSNGVKYNRTGGSVTINCERKAGPRLRFNIIDTGFGIPKDKQDALFEPFNRLGRESGEIDGTGIGLTITAHLMEILDGDFGFESEEDKGSTFWAEFSLDAPAPTAEAVDAGRASAD